MGNFLQKISLLREKIVFTYISIYYFSFLLSFREIDSKIIWYRGFKYFEQPLYINIISFILSITPSFFIPRKNNRISTYFFWMSYLIVYIPFFAATPHFYEQPQNYFLIYAFSLFFCFILMIKINDYYELKFFWNILPICKEKIKKKLTLNEDKAFFIIFMTSFIIVMIIFYFFGFKGFDFLILQKTYLIRNEFNDKLKESPFFIKYLFKWSVYFFSPLMTTWGYIKKIKIYIAYGLIASLYLVSISAYKSSFFYIFVQIALLFLYKKANRYFLFIFILSPLVLIYASLAIDLILLKRYFLYPLITSRLLSMHSSLSYYYLDFFSKNDFFLLRESSIVNFIFKTEKPYLNIPNTIGLYVFQNPKCHANENFWVEAYANFGILGTFIYTLILSFILKIIDMFNERKYFIVYLLTFLYPMTVLLNGSLPSCILSGGLLISFITLSFLSIFSDEKNKFL